MITLAISKCYGKVRVLFFPRDNSLISRGNSHVSRVRGLVVRCLLFNQEVSCSNPWVCANFLTSIPKHKFFTFFGTMRLFGFVRLFFEFFQMFPKSPPFNFLIFCNRKNVKKSQRVPLFQNFRHYETVQNSHFCFFSKVFLRLPSHFLFFFFKNFQCLQRVHPSFCLISCNRTNVKKSQRVPFSRFFGTMRLSLKFFIFCFFFENFLKTPKSPPSIL